MADENRIDHDPEDLENLSPEELQEHIREDKKKAKRSLRFAFTALIAIIAVCIAWFAANNQVTMTGTQISAENDQPFELASVGDRTQAETKFLLDEQNLNILSAGKETKYAKYKYKDITAQAWKVKETPQTYYVGNSGLAWHLNGQESLSPGASGKLEFYLISKKEGLTSAEITVNLKAYINKSGTGSSDNEAGTSANKSRATESTNNTVQNLISGHILLFQELDDAKGYDGWLGKWEDNTNTLTNTFTVSANSTFEKNIPYKVTIYWVWPQYFRNYIYTQRSTQGDLFTDQTSQTEESDYKKLNTFVNANAQKTFSTSRLFYQASLLGDAKVNDINQEINASMSDEVLNSCSTYYNQADEYIGKNAQYIYVEMEVN